MLVFQFNKIKKLTKKYSLTFVTIEIIKKSPISLS